MLMESVLALKTNERVLAQMVTSVARGVCPAEMLEQRVSYVYGSVSHENSATKQQVREVICANVGGARAIAAAAR